jgi:hypothetical protein
MSADISLIANCVQICSVFSFGHGGHPPPHIVSKRIDIWSSLCARYVLCAIAEGKPEAMVENCRFECLVQVSEWCSAVLSFKHFAVRLGNFANSRAGELEDCLEKTKKWGTLPLFLILHTTKFVWKTVSFYLGENTNRLIYKHQPVVV